jgi:hypothetical protein
MPLTFAGQTPRAADLSTDFERETAGYGFAVVRQFLKMMFGPSVTQSNGRVKYTTTGIKVLSDAFMSIRSF